MRPRNKEELSNEFNVEKQREIFFTMKVYATTTAEGKLNTLKYTIDLHPPFEANSTTTSEPYASPLVGSNKDAFGRIFHNVTEVFKYLSDPRKYKYTPYPGDKATKPASPAPFRVEEMKNIETALKLSKDAINYVTYESNSPSALSVGALFRATGNGDMKPPPK